jgi:hypothetical protein
MKTASKPLESIGYLTPVKMAPAKAAIELRPLGRLLNYKSHAIGTA